MRNEVKKSRVARWWIFGLVLMVLTATVLAILNAGGLIFQTEVERRTFERSYQYRAGQQQQNAIMQAQLTEIEQQLLDPKLDPQTRHQLRAQAAAIRVRLNASTRRR
jgi:hypothetical protein